MMPGKSTAATVALLALTSAAALSGAPPAAAEAPLSPANDRVGALCSAPAPGRSSCLGLNVIAKAPRSLPGVRALAARSRRAGAPSRQNVAATETTLPRPAGLTPGNLRGAYGLSATPAPASTQTIAIVDAYEDPNAEADLATFSSQFGLPACTRENGCFSKANQEGKSWPLPPYKGEGQEPGWALEIATDIETAHAVCRSCHILLVEAKSNNNADLFAAENAAVRLGATEISNSWGGPEPEVDSLAFNHPGVVITAAAGDSGYLRWLESQNSAEYPASSPHVVGVGGTRLQESSGRWERETVWNDGGEESGKKTGAGASGGGCSGVFAAPLWQQQASTWSGIGCSRRAVADVSADGDPYTGVDVYDSIPFEGNSGWTIVGGTSVASPIIAAIFALAGGAHGVEYPAHTLYENAAAAPGAWLHDVSSGSNGRCTRPFERYTGTSGCTTSEEAASCSSHGICLAGTGYDGPGGVGTPRGIGAFQLLGESKEAVREEGGGGSAPGTGTSTPAGPVAAGGAEVAPREANAGAPPTLAPAARVRVSGLKLTRKAARARSRRPRVARVGFAFTLSARARVTVTLAKWGRFRSGGRWHLAARPVSFDGSAGRQSRPLNARRALAAGRYTLTVSPSSGVPVSLVFQVA